MPTDLTLAAIVDANPDAARILEHHQLDYCCGGQRTLEQACAERGLDPAEVRADLAAAPAAGEGVWTAMGPAQLVDHQGRTNRNNGGAADTLTGVRVVAFLRPERWRVTAALTAPAPVLQWVPSGRIDARGWRVSCQSWRASC